MRAVEAGPHINVAVTSAPGQRNNHPFISCGPTDRSRRACSKMKDYLEFPNVGLISVAGRAGGAMLTEADGAECYARACRAASGSKSGLHGIRADAIARPPA